MKRSKCGKDARSFIYILDKDENILFVNKEWTEFATENDAEELTAENVVGQNLWDLVQDRSIRTIYRSIFRRVRKGKPITGLPFRCDAPDCRRFMEMSFKKNFDQIRIETRVLKQEPRKPVPLLSGYEDRSAEKIIMCSLCKKVQVSTDTWVEAEEAIVRLKLQDVFPLPRVSHGGCPPCIRYWESL